jgi:DUF1009 family protein
VSSSAPDAPSPAVALAAGDRVCLIAGSGRLPANVAAGLKAMGHAPFVIIAGGEKANLDELGAYDHTTVELERMADIGPLLRRERITHIVFAGGIGRRPRLTSLRPSWALLRMIGRLLPVLGKGDNALLSTVIGLFEEHGYKVVGPHQLVPDLLVRVKSLRAHPRLAARKRGVLVKCAKPGQELRADLPSIGPQTVTAAHEAGLAGIGVEAGRSIVLDCERVRGLADELGLFVIGMPARQP